MSSSIQSNTSASFLAIVGLVVALVAAATIEAHPLHSQSTEITSTSTNINANMNQHSPQVQTSSGKLMGIKQQLNSNQSIYKFLAVPYAQAPIGALRFQRPVELNETLAQSSPGKLLDASKFGKTCPQFRHLTRFISPLLNIDPDHQTSEDCLHLNVFVPSSVVDEASNINGTSTFAPINRLPVIVWIPGEGFDFADARQFDGSYLAHKTQSIVITIQYRVGVLGFLHAPKLGITGNMGVYDQLMALKWIQQNVHAFGGDSERVTLMGRFSGSMSISAIITAPKQQELLYNQETGQPLFSRVAMLSGVAVDNWIIDSHQAERMVELERQILNKSLCTRDQLATNNCLSSLPLEQLLPLAGYGWRLVADGELIGQKAPIEAIKFNQLAPHLEAVLLGETGMEGTLCLYRHLLNSHSSNFAQLIEEDKMTTNDLYEILRDDSRTYFRYNISDTNPIQSTLESLIDSDSSSTLGSEVSEQQLRDKYLNACSSYMVKSHAQRFKRNILARNQMEENRLDSRRKSVEVFHYELKYKPTFSLAPDYIKVAAHGDDIPLIFGLVYQQPRQEINQQDLLVSKKMISYIGNFVHGNNPLLRQHQTLEQSTDSSNTNNETTSMDDNETAITSSDSMEPSQSHLMPFAPVAARRSWSSEAQVFPIELSESDLRELARRTSQQRDQIQRSRPQQDQQQQQQQQQVAAAVRVFVMAEQRPGDELMVQQQQQQQQIGNINRLSGNIRREDPHMNLWFQYPMMSRRQQSAQLQAASTSGQQQHQQVSLLSESSFMTMLLFSSCIIVFAMMSFCLGLCLVVFRYNLTSMHTKGVNSGPSGGQSTQKFVSSSTSSCNICGDDSRPGSLNAVTLTGHLPTSQSNRKSAVDNRGFFQMFNKLTSSAPVPTTTTTPISTKQQQAAAKEDSSVLEGEATQASATSGQNTGLVVSPTNHQRASRCELNGSTNN